MMMRLIREYPGYVFALVVGGFFCTGASMKLFEDTILRLVLLIVTYWIWFGVVLLLFYAEVKRRKVQGDR